MENFCSQRYVDILYDDIFKLIFTKPENNDLLLSLLRNVLPSLDIQTVSLVNNEQIPVARRKKRSIFDVNCTTSSGVKIIVEVQHSYIPDYMDRMLYYSSFPILAQHSAGDKKYYLTPVYVVSFVNFVLDHDTDWIGDFGLISRYSIREDGNGELMTDSLHFVFVELGRFLKSKAQLETEMDWWLYCLKNMKDITEVPDNLDYDIIHRLLFATDVASMTVEEKEEYYRIMTTQRDIEIWKEEAREEGLAEGRAVGLAEGRAEGKTEGKAEGKAEVAKAMLVKGMDASLVSELSGLPIEQLKALC